MINLLPNDFKQSVMYARRNTTLLKWAVCLMIALAGIGGLLVGGRMFIGVSVAQETALVESARESLKAQKLEETSKRLEDISGTVKLVVQVLSREVLFSKLLRQLGATLPANTVLSQLQIDKVQGGITIKAAATDIQAATQLQLNLQDPNNKIFEKADIESINCLPAQPGTKYPCTVQIKALFAKNNPFLFLNSGGGQ